jgi:hypothetical protein
MGMAGDHAPVFPRKSLDRVAIEYNAQINNPHPSQILELGRSWATDQLYSKLFASANWGSYFILFASDERQSKYKVK